MFTTFSENHTLIFYTKGKDDAIFRRLFSNAKNYLLSRDRGVKLLDPSEVTVLKRKSTSQQQSKIATTKQNVAAELPRIFCTEYMLKYKNVIIFVYLTYGQRTENTHLIFNNT